MHRLTTINCTGYHNYCWLTTKRPGLTIRQPDETDVALVLSRTSQLVYTLFSCQIFPRLIVRFSNPWPQ